ncbi:MAG: hypothetical protein ACK400_18230, partial [Pseudanabaena sp.]
ARPPPQTFFVFLMGASLNKRGPGVGPPILFLGNNYIFHNASSYGYNCEGYDKKITIVYRLSVVI